MIKSRWLICFLFTLLCATQAALAYSPTARDQRGNQLAPQEPGPDVILQEGVNKMTTFLKNVDKIDPITALAFIEQEIAPYFDFAYMARWSAGHRYRRLSDSEKADRVNQIKKMLLSSLVKNLGVYNNQNIRYFRPRPGRQGEVSVAASIIQERGYPTKLDFRFYHSKTGWKIFDVTANGTSASVYYRNYFNQTRRNR